MYRKILSDYSMLVVLVVLCALFSVLSLEWRMPEHAGAADNVAERIEAEFAKDDVILVAGETNKGSEEFARHLDAALREMGFTATRLAVGTPGDVRAGLDEIRDSGADLRAVATTGSLAKDRLVERLSELYPAFSGHVLVTPPLRLWPVFLTRSNLLGIVNRIVVIAVIAIGMSMVIITGGIDLSVGSLIALSAVTCTYVMKCMGGLQASGWVVPLGFMAGILACGAVGGAGGFIVARFRVPPFVTTLAFMMMGRGLAFMVTGGFSIYQVPKGLTWLGQGTILWVPNTVLLLALLYVAAHVFMSHTRMGRHIYAVGGNPEAARLSGVPVRRVIVFVYVVSGLAAGLGGCITASQLNTGSPSFGKMDELYVIAAVVVGGTSLSGGSGRMLGTLIGAFIISVIQNGMNLMGLESYTQEVVLGAVILGALLLDRARSSGGLARYLERLLASARKGVR